MRWSANALCWPQSAFVVEGEVEPLVLRVRPPLTPMTVLLRMAALLSQYLYHHAVLLTLRGASSGALEAMGWQRWIERC